MSQAASHLNTVAQGVKDNAVFIALGLYSAVIGTGWLAFADSFN